MVDRQFETTNLACGVEFDIDNDGAKEAMAWTSTASDEAFLALDRDGNGLIDTGSELFGDHTPQPPSDVRHGFKALALFDQPLNGGDGDGRITSNDRIYDRLLLWTDRNHDAISQPDELSSLADSGV